MTGTPRLKDNSAKWYHATPRAREMKTYRARRVVRSDRGGSSWPVIVETDAGLFYTKLRGSAQAPASLVAEVVVGALADALHLPVPARVLIDIPPDIEVDDPHQELAQLLEFSVGRNLGFHVLPDARDFRLVDLPTVEAPLASAIVWLDGLVQNPDRTVRNPNLLWSGGRLWLVDHGAALGFQHNWHAVTEASPRTASWRLDHHVLCSRATELPALDDGLAEQLPRATLEAAIAAVPDDFLVVNGGEPQRRRRAAYTAYLWKRLKHPRPFVWSGVPDLGVI